MPGGAIQGPGGLWLADIAANLLCIVLVLLASLASQQGRQAPPDAPIPMPEVSFAPLDAQAIVELLRLRLDPDAAPEVGRIDLTRMGPRPVKAPEAASLALVYVFDPTHHAELVAQLRARGMDWIEIDVPEALQSVSAASEAGAERPGADETGADWAAGFLSLQGVAARPERFRTDLARLLAAGPTGSSAADTPPARPEQPRARRSLSDLAARLAALGNLILASLAVALSALVWSRGRRAARA